MKRTATMILIATLASPAWGAEPPIINLRSPAGLGQLSTNSPVSILTTGTEVVRISRDGKHVTCVRPTAKLLRSLDESNTGMGAIYRALCWPGDVTTSIVEGF